MTWIQTAKGNAFDLLGHTPADISFEEIAFALSRINRFSGHVGWRRDPRLRRAPYSVAQHCVIGADWLVAQGEPMAALGFLLHDAHEAYLGDITSPVIEALSVGAPGFRGYLDQLRRRIDLSVCSALRVEGALQAIGSSRVREIDLAMLRTERDQLHFPPPRAWAVALERCAPLPIIIDDIASAAIAERRWLDRLLQVTRLVTIGAPHA